MLRLLRYRVTGFRSVVDSGWIETDAVSALIGVNESGKTNLVLPLWKLNPANEGEIEPISDYPRSEYSELRNQDQTRVFVTAIFQTDRKTAEELATLAGLTWEQFNTVQVARRFDGKWITTFPDAAPPQTASSSEIQGAIDTAARFFDAQQGNEIANAAFVAALRVASSILGSKETLTKIELDRVLEKLREAPTEGEEPADGEEPSGEHWAKLLETVSGVSERLDVSHPNSNEQVRKLALKHLPEFVYYSNYGNLDSEIFLPHVIENLGRDDLGTKEAAKARTLRVLFNFVGLQPSEILELGKSVTRSGTAKPTDEQIAAAARNTKERSILLQSASSKLTKEFRSWWKQGDYRFRFEADGEHFRIWVSDDRRPEEIELEARSTGLQWFLSFFLVFLVESGQAHKDAILLLDEPGLSLHPLSQKDLSIFFDGLSKTNQLVYTTHSPFLVDPDRLDRVKAVYVDGSGATVVSTDLRAGKAASPEFKSVYAVHSALGLSVSDGLLQGCTNVIVEGASDQLYLSAIKIVLIALGKLIPQRELLFLPGGGAKGVTALVPIFTGKDEAPPHVIFDSDSQGLGFAQKLRDGTIYVGDYSAYVHNVGDILPDIANAEVEDLIPHELMVSIASRMYRGADDDFSEVAKSDTAIIPQIENYARAAGLDLAPGWKVDLARTVKQHLIKAPEKWSAATLELWGRLFAPFSSRGTEPGDAKVKDAAPKSRSKRN